MLLLLLLVAIDEPESSSEPTAVEEWVVPPSEPPLFGALVPPFSAWVAGSAAHVKLRPQANAPTIGVVRGGDMVVVKSCVPSCDAEHAWALLDPMGAMALAALRTSDISPERLRQATFVHFQYGSVQVKKLEILRNPNESAAVVARGKKGDVLAFVDDETVAPPGWLLRPGGGYARAANVKLARPSAFFGVHDPAGALAFALHALTLPLGGAIARHGWFRVEGVRGNRVLVAGGSVPRSAVRLAFHRHRPLSVPPGRPWVHVDLREQVLTAYEGDKWVLATLISSGRAGHVTLPGTFRVQQKVAHTAMSRSKYFVDEVPFIQYFNKSQALHGAFWHDNFGTPVSHGCVNLSIADALWLFDWSKPELPAGWQSLVPFNANLDSLWVAVEKAPALGVFEPVPAAEIGGVGDMGTEAVEVSTH